MGSGCGNGGCPADRDDTLLEDYPGPTLDEGNFPRQDRGPD